MVETAMEWCIAAKWLERYTLNDQPDIIRYWPPIAEDGDNLEAVYKAITGDDAGKKKAKTLRVAIEEWKAIATE